MSRLILIFVFIFYFTVGQQSQAAFGFKKKSNNATNVQTASRQIKKKSSTKKTNTNSRKRPNRRKATTNKRNRSVTTPYYNNRRTMNGKNPSIQQQYYASTGNDIISVNEDYYNRTPQTKQKKSLNIKNIFYIQTGVSIGSSVVQKRKFSSTNMETISMNGNYYNKIDQATTTKRENIYLTIEEILFLKATNKVHPFFGLVFNVSDNDLRSKGQFQRTAQIFLQNTSTSYATDSGNTGELTQEANINYKFKYKTYFTLGFKMGAKLNFFKPVSFLPYYFIGFTVTKQSETYHITKNTTTFNAFNNNFVIPWNDNLNSVFGANIIQNDKHMRLIFTTGFGIDALVLNYLTLGIEYRMMTDHMIRASNFYVNNSNQIIKKQTKDKFNAHNLSFKLGIQF